MVPMMIGSLRLRWASDQAGTTKQPAASPSHSRDAAQVAVEASRPRAIMSLVEQSHLPVRRTLATLGILPGTFYRWYDRFQTGGPEALEDRSSRPRRVWNRIPDDVREQVVELALDEPELSPRELATRFTDTKKYFVSEASAYRLLKARDLIPSPACPSSDNLRQIGSM